MQDDSSQPASLAQRLTRLATELAELAMTVADQEQRQRQRDQAVEQALAQLADLSTSLQSLARISAPPPPSNPPAPAAEPPSWQQPRHDEPAEQQRW